MSGDEAFVMLVSIVLGPLAWLHWFRVLLRADPLHRRVTALRATGLALLLCIAALFAVLKTLAAHDVRDSGLYMAFYLLLGLAWLRLTERMLPWLGLTARDDVIERGNDAALPAALGYFGAMTLAFAGGNIGDGPGWWVVIFCAVLSSLTVVAVWGLLQLTAGISELVTVDRDVAAGWRLAGLLLATGAIAGRAVAGNWTSADATLTDFFVGATPVLLLVVAAVLVEKAFAPTAAHHGEAGDEARGRYFGRGIVPALAYVAFAAAAVVRAGWPT